MDSQEVGMRQLTCTGPGTVEWLDVPEPDLVAETDALVRPVTVARCDIDRTLIAAGSTRAPCFALGHEAVVEVLSVGPAVTRVSPRSLALPSFWISCGSCARCAAGKPASCTTYPLLSSYGMEPLSGFEYGGMLSDVVRVPDADYMLTPLPDGVDPVTVASLADNVVDGYRLVAPHLARRPQSDVLLASHGSPSIGLYAALADRIGATARRVDFSTRPTETWPIVADCGVDQVGFHWAVRATEPDGVVHSMGSVEPAASINLLRLFTLGIEFHIGRAHSAALLPEVARLVADGVLHPELVTTDVVDWEDALARYLEPSVKLIVQR
jgi:threonine dehydrogenase-like Zn-dependent dehydrogenase